ncbi:putative DNA repair protein [Apostichopus japonicus]|uniref:Putative DNA repair protein n=1 Tax=Stichopus japonicus TaxID=307972 RepID=A0A2G8KP34_STIJA|nr:putative DNA repair protein [Apostichopus japonicus]
MCISVYRCCCKHRVIEALQITDYVIMSHFNKISIRGIRSFSPEERERQTVLFGTPLTVILGENGTGKTSIIECLRFVCAGEYPPGGREAFLHSLELAGPNTAEGEIELNFTNKGNQNVAIRRCVTVKENKRQQEGWYKIGDSWQPVTSKKDLSMMMNDELGVSSSILSNVLFCHQEESCWPLDKERALKEKFDKFFEVTRYNKLLIELTTMINKQKYDLNIYEDKAKDIQDSKEKVERLGKMIEKEETEKAHIENQIDELEMKTLAVEEELCEIRRKIQIGEEIRREICYLEGKRRDLDTDRLRLKEKLRRQSTETLGTKDLKEQLIATEGGIKKLERLKKMSLSRAESVRKEMEEMKVVHTLEEERVRKQQRVEELGLALAEKKDGLKLIIVDLVSQCNSLPQDLEHIINILIETLDCGDMKKNSRTLALEMQENVWKSVEALTLVKTKACKITSYVQERIMELQIRLKNMNKRLDSNPLEDRLTMKRKLSGLSEDLSIPMTKKFKWQKCDSLQPEEKEQDAITKLVYRICLLDQTLKDLNKLEMEIMKHRESCLEDGQKSLEETSTEYDTLLSKIENIDNNLKQSFDKLSNCRREEEKKKTEEEKLKEFKRNIVSKKFTYKGTLSELTKTIAERRAEYLKSQKIVNKESRDNAINLMTMRDVTHDLEQYRNALDEAIVKFHRMKLLEVNEEIKRLWVKTYQGNDIDSINIEADVDKGDGRRAYNYRVEMVKGKKRMNMRERCSMGQKDSPSQDLRGICGVLALDEPTTNLDEPNVRALATALKSIITECASQSNFQLVIISHNETFVDILARDYGKHCYRVTRDQHKHSVVMKYDTEFLQLPSILMLESIQKQFSEQDRKARYFQNGH